MAAASLTRPAPPETWSDSLEQAAAEALRTISEIRIEICWRKSMTGVCFCWKDTTWFGLHQQGDGADALPRRMMGCRTHRPAHRWCSPGSSHSR